MGRIFLRLNKGNLFFFLDIFRNYKLIPNCTSLTLNFKYKTIEHRVVSVINLRISVNSEKAIIMSWYLGEIDAICTGQTGFKPDGNVATWKQLFIFNIENKWNVSLQKLYQLLHNTDCSFSKTHLFESGVFWNSKNGNTRRDKLFIFDNF